MGSFSYSRACGLALNHPRVIISGLLGMNFARYCNRHVNGLLTSPALVSLKKLKSTARFLNPHNPGRLERRKTAAYLIDSLEIRSLDS